MASDSPPSFEPYYADDDRQPLFQRKVSSSPAPTSGFLLQTNHHEHLRSSASAFEQYDGSSPDGDIGRTATPYSGLSIHPLHIDTVPATPGADEARLGHRSRDVDPKPSPHFSSFSSSGRTVNDNYKSPPGTPKLSSGHLSCPSRAKMWKGGTHILYLTHLTLAVFSTIFSCLYLGISILKPQYHRIIDDANGKLSYSNASLVFTLFAKLIELSFISAFVVFVGQIVSGRAFIRKQGHGITLAELSMRSWIMSPGTMLLSPSDVASVFRSLLGVLVILAAVAGTLYTTAANALVSPKISMGSFENLSLRAPVQTSFANFTYIGELCKTPINSDSLGASTRRSTCLEIELAASSYKNYITWLTKWESDQTSRNTTDQVVLRPPGVALLSDNIAVTGSWVQPKNTALQIQHQRWISNVSLAMPHAGVVTASKDPINHLLQPQPKNNFGSFNLHASVSSPVVNVLCANMSAEELKPVVYASWDGVNTTAQNWTNWTAMASDPSIIPQWSPDEWLNSTVVDDQFQLGPHYGLIRPPIFPRLPQEYNTILNNTGVYISRNGLWLLGAAPAEVGGYALCSLRAHTTPACSTWFNSTSAGSTLSTQCNDDMDPLQYRRNAPDATSGNETISLDWVDLASGWGNAVSLSSGITDGKASNARLLNQMIPRSSAPDPEIPTISEALAVMVAGTLLMSSQDASFSLKPVTGGSAPYNDSFRASIRSVQYASGAAAAGYQNALYIVLVLVFCGNILVLYWLIQNKGLMTDYADPSNLFALAINSPPSHMFAGSCGVGPSAAQSQTRWYVNAEGDHLYISNEQRKDEGASRGHLGEGGMETRPSPVMQTYSRLAERKSIL